MPSVTSPNWQNVSLGNIFSLHTLGCTPGDEPNRLYWHHSLPAWDATGGPVLESGDSIGSNKYLVTEPSILVSKLNPRITRVSVLDSITKDPAHCTSTEFMVFVPILEEISLSFYGYYLASNHFQLRLEQAATGTTKSHTRATPSETLNWIIPFPPLPEQRRIAEILDTADAAIRETERVIAKLRQVKQGLLHDLLTRGLDEAGHLRDPEACPEQFKDSAVGRIPKEWRIEKGEDITELITKGASPRWQGFEYQTEGTLFITSENVREGFLDVSDPKFISEDFDLKLQRSRLELGDILINLVGASIGRSCIYSGEFGSANINQAVCTFRLKRDIEPNCVLSYLQMPKTVSRLLEDQVETARANISLGQIGKFLFPLPSIREQCRIATILEAHDARIRAEEEILAKRRQLKRGLMDNLLTGRVRV